MGGSYPKGKEPNFYRPDPGSTEICVRLWPTRAVFSGAEIGNPIKTGGEAFRDRAAPGSTVRRAYDLHNQFEGRSSWDYLEIELKVLHYETINVRSSSKTVPKRAEMPFTKFCYNAGILPQE
jgi:hypothetical protein